MKILNSNSKNFYSELDKIINKRKIVNKSTLRTVEKIINDVRKNKDLALVKYERKFNNNSQIVPSKKEIATAIKLLDPSVKRAIDDTYKRVKDWHLKQKPKDIYYKDKLGNKFYYRNLTEKVENKFLLRVLNLINIEYLNYRKFGYTNYIKNFTSDCVKLTNPVLKKFTREINYKNIFNFYNLAKDKTDILEIYLSC